MFRLDSGLNEHHAGRLAEETHVLTVGDLHLFHVPNEVALRYDFVVARDEVFSFRVGSSWRDGRRRSRCDVAGLFTTF